MVKVSDYPSVDEIRNAIPEEGLPLGQLVSKFAKRLDDTNASLFYKLLCLSTVFEEKGWVKATEEAPKKDDIEAIEKEAKKPRDPLPKLRLDQERRITSNLHNFVEMFYSSFTHLLNTDTRQHVFRASRVSAKCERHTSICALQNILRNFRHPVSLCEYAYTREMSRKPRIEA